MVLRTTRPGDDGELAHAARSDEHFTVEWQVDERLHVVSYRDVPLRVYLGATSHMNQLLEELLQLRAGQTTGNVAPAAELGRALDETLAGYREFEQQSLYDASLAQQTGAARFSFEFRVPGIAVADFERVVLALRRLDEYSRRGVLLTPPAPPQTVELRQWIALETAHQLRGGGPRPCPLN